MYLIDFSPFHESYIDSLLFSWEELHSMDGKETVIRVLETNHGVQPNFTKMMSGLPYELANIDKFSSVLSKDGMPPKNVEDLIDILKD